MCDARAAIMRDDIEAVEAQHGHHRDLIGRHRALRIIRVRGIARQFFAVAITAQVGRDDREAFRKLGHNLVPGQMRLRVAVEQQQRRSRTADRGADAHAVRIDVPPAEPRHEFGIFGTIAHRWQHP